ncbi:MAG: M48 family metalloprotease [Blastocatellia bacterium]|nr:M48 family metalloprotease [Blastocatellia bacterium]
MRSVFRSGLVVLLALVLCPWPLAASPSGNSRLVSTPQKSNPKEESILDAVAEAVPLGKEALRAIVKPMLDTVTISPRQEMEIGDAFFKEIRKKLGAKLDRNAADVAYLTSIGNTLAVNVRRKGIKYKFHVVEENVPNAFAIAGGHVFVYRGLLNKCINSEAQLAVVLGHEISHVDAEHTVDFYKPVVAASQLPFADVAVMIAALASKVLTFSYNEPQESQADELGAGLAFKARYEPSEGAAVQRRLKALNPSGVRDPLTGLADSILRTHPPSEKRALALEAISKKLHRADPNRKTYVGSTNYAQRTPITSRIYE